MNKIFIIGNLTRDPELRTTTSGISVCTFNVAVTRRFAQQGGERQTDFFRINAWRQLGDVCAKYLAKGRKVAVVGELQARTYEGNDGVTKFSLDISADEVEFLTPKGQQENGQAPYAPAAPARVNTPAGGSPMDDLAGFENIREDELPF
ncbi:MAG: single-stranded DNA-binding protein [Clostridiales bacterium]|jgi:single-strand DNA-binding protein|nr:single-stranded DNA-binding protein [Clostridiales bacterium]